MSSCSLGTPDQNDPTNSQDQDCKENICLVLLIGVPGSGKSYFRSFLETFFKGNSKTVLGIVKVFSVSYDDFCKVRNPTQFSDTISWKEERSEIVKATELITSNLVHNGQICNIALNNIHVVNSEITKPDTILFIIDDNMYYRSMRYEYYKLSRSYNLSFCEIFFNATLQDALRHNIQRKQQSIVPDFVIKEMFEKLEPPNKNISWEKNMLWLTPYTDYEKDNVLDSVLFLIETALKCPIQQHLESLHREESQQINNSNCIHQIDIVLKQLVADLIKKKIKECRDSPSTISQYFSERRLRLLKDIKNRKVVLPVDLSKPITKQTIDLIKPILLDFLSSPRAS